MLLENWLNNPHNFLGYNTGKLYNKIHLQVSDLWCMYPLAPGEPSSDKALLVSHYYPLSQ